MRSSKSSGKITERDEEAREIVAVSYTDQKEANKYKPIEELRQQW